MRRKKVPENGSIRRALVFRLFVLFNEERVSSYRYANLCRTLLQIYYSYTYNVLRIVLSECEALRSWNCIEICSLVDVCNSLYILPWIPFFQNLSI